MTSTVSPVAAGLAAPPSQGPSAGDVVRTVLRGLGQLLITVGLVLLLFCFYELKITSLVTARDQTALGHQLDERWRTPLPSPAKAAGPAVPLASTPPAAPAVPAAVSLGDAFARLYLPTIDGDSRVVVQGVGVEDLKRGPGHLPGTADPGAVGNLVFSGHRTTYGAPFNRLDELRPGDPVVVETRTSWFTYRVTGTQVVAPTAVQVTLPVPGRPGVAPTQRLLTMTTCNPKYSARQRMIVSAVLAEDLPKGGARPAALGGG